MRGVLTRIVSQKKTIFLRVALLLCVMGVCVVSMSACKKKENDSDVQKFWVRGWYLEGKSMPLLITDPDYSAGYHPEPTPIALSVKDGVDLSQYEDGDIIEIEVDGINETYPCQTTVYDVRFIEHGDVMDIDEKVLEQLAEYGWIELNTVTTID